MKRELLIDCHTGTQDLPGAPAGQPGERCRNPCPDRLL